MKKYIIKRLLWSVLILFIVAFLLYILMRSLPTSYLEQIARQKSQQPGSKTFEEWMQQLEATYGMDKGIVPGFFAWLSKAVRGDFGDSWKYTVPVTRKFTEVVGISFHSARNHCGNQAVFRNRQCHFHSCFGRNFSSDLLYGILIETHFFRKARLV